MDNKLGKKPKSFIKWLTFILFGGLLVRLFYVFTKRDSGEWLVNFAREEGKELEKLVHREEDLRHFELNTQSIFKHYFIPHPANGHKPHILRSRSLVVVAVFLLLLKVAALGYLYIAFPENARLSTELIERVLELTNADRTAEQVGVLVIDPVLTASAQAKANDLAGKGYFAHESPDGRKPWDFIDREQYRYLLVGENLAMNFTSAESVHKALMASPGHRKNIMNGRYTEIGLAVAEGVIDGQETTVLVEFFATRAAAPRPVLAAAPATEPLTPAPAVTIASGTVAVASDSKTVTPATVAKSDKPASSPVPVTPKPAPSPEPVTPKPAPIPASPVPAPSTPIASASIAAIDDFSSRVEQRALPDLEPSWEIAMADTSGTLNASLAGVTPVRMPNIDERAIITSSVVRAVNLVFAAMLGLFAIALLLNIFIRVHIQHRPVIIQTLALMLFIGGLWFVRLHYLESGLPDMFIL